MTDRELLELSAKAAGYEFDDGRQLNPKKYLVRLNGTIEEWRGWNPLTDDGDALRLAVKLNIAVHPGFAYTPTGKLINYRDHANRIAATRRAIVRAAAEIGRQM